MTVWLVLLKQNQPHSLRLAAAGDRLLAVEHQREHSEPHSPTSQT